MGNFDCYCAICGGSLVEPEIGSWAPAALKRRRGRVARRRQARDVTEEFNSSDEEEDEDDEYNSEEEQWSEDHEELSYDPELVSGESAAWLMETRCLGLNPSAEGPKKAFISGRGTYDDDGRFDVELGDDPNQPTDERSFDCFYVFEPDRVATFPFHDCCFEILTKAITGLEDAGNIDKDVLYNAMASRLPSKASATYLDLDYGDFLGRDQCWESIPGEEFTVTHPTVVPGAEEFIRDAILRDEFKARPVGVDTPQLGPLADPFSKLPHEILHMIYGYIPGKSLLTLTTASWSALVSTRNNQFWKLFISWDMPWLWELEEIIGDTQPMDLDYKSLYLWLDAAITPKYGVIGPFMGLANRRRIWGACQQLASSYFKQLEQRPSLEVDAEILEQSRCLHMPFVSLPQPAEELGIQKKLWAHSWPEMDDQPALFETFWNDDLGLVGIGVAWGGTTRRIFGADNTSDLTVRKNAMPVGSRDWIEGLILRIPSVGGVGDKASTAIRGVTIMRKFGDMLSFGNATGNYRLLIASPGNVLVGVTGQIGRDGAIARLGILECPRASDSYVHGQDVEANFTQRLMWDNMPFITTMRSTFPSAAPLWSHPTATALPLATMESTVGKPTGDLTPHRLLLWAKDSAEIAKVGRVSLRVRTGDGTEQGNTVFGMRVEFVRRYWEPKRYVGHRKLDDEGDLEDWPDDQMIHLDIDGYGGEFISEVAVATADCPRAVMLKTNKGNQVSVGNPEQREWSVRYAPEGEQLIGLVLAFAPRLGTQNDDKLVSIAAVSRKFEMLQ